VQPEVDRQSNELIDRDLVRPSDSPTASTIVCVAKADRGGRIAGDYRHMNLIYRLIVYVAICMYIMSMLYTRYSELCHTKTDSLIIQCRSIVCIVRLYILL